MPRGRITYIHQHFALPAEGGGGRPWEFARRLAEDGYEVTVISGAPDAATSTIDGVRIVRLKSAYGNRMNSMDRMISFVRFMIKSTVVATKVRADLVFASSTPLTVAVPAIIASTIRRVPFVFEVRDLWPSVPARLGYLDSRLLLWLAQRLERTAYMKASRIIALSPGMREGILQTHPHADVVVIPNAADVGLFRRTAGQRQVTRERLGWEGLRVAVYAGSFGRTYRIDWLVQLGLNCRSATLQMFGEGAASGDAERVLRDAGVRPEQILQGRVGKSELADFLSSADVCISSIMNHPALHVNSLNKVFDALAAGRPLVFNHDGWLAEMVIAAGAGWRLDDDPFRAAIQLDAILADTSALATAAAAAEELAPQFDREVLYHRFASALAPLISTGARIGKVS